MTFVLFLMKVILFLIKFIIIFVSWFLIVSFIKKKSKKRVPIIAVVITLFAFGLLYIPFEKPLLIFDSLEKAIKYPVRPFTVILGDNFAYVFHGRDSINSLFYERQAEYKISLFYKNQLGWKIAWPLSINIGPVKENSDIDTVIFHSYSNPNNNDLILILECSDIQSILDDTEPMEYVVYDMDGKKFESVPSDFRDINKYNYVFYGIVNKNDDYILINNTKVSIDTFIEK